MSGPSSRVWLRYVLVLCIGLSSWFASHAREIPGYPDSVDAFDPREVAMLPSYCIYTELFRTGVPGGNNPQMIEAWTREVGEIFRHMHHYCFAIMKINRALLLSRSTLSRNFYLNDSIIELDYVITKASQDWILLPELVTKRGEVLIYLGKGHRAVYEFERAINLKPDYWPPYAHLSDYYKSLGDPRKAREVLEQGLKQSPNAAALQRRMSELKAPAPSAAAK